MKSVKRIIFSLFIIFCLFFISCESDLRFIDTSNNIETDNPDNFEYIPSSDEPLSKYNAQEGGGSLKYYEDYLYINSFGNTKPFYRLNIESGSLLPVHTDPLCSHDSADCPLYGMQFSYYLYENKVFFRKQLTTFTDNGIDYWSGFVSYDMTNGKLNVLSEEEDPTSYGEYTRQLYVDNYRYYYDYVYSDKLDRYIDQICRMDLDSGQSIVIGGQDNYYDVNAEHPDSLSERFLFVLDSPHLFHRQQEYIFHRL